MKQLLSIMGLLLASLNVSAIDIQHWETQKGAKVLFVENQALPMVDVRVVFNAGSARDRIPGTANLTNGLLDTGAGDMDANEIAERLENVGAQMSNSAARDMATVSLRSLVDEARLDEALSVFVDVLASPRFPKADFEREKKRFLLSLKSAKKQPKPVIQRAFYKALYDTHPYGEVPSGSEESVERLLQLHLIRFHKKYYVARNATIAIVGALDKDQADAVAARISDALAEGQAPSKIPVVADLKEGKRQDVTLDTQQSHILIGQPVLTRGDKDYFDLYVGNHILGGSGFASVLMQKIREDKGLAYSVYSYFAPMQQAGPFVMGMQTRNDQKEEAISLLMQNVNEFIQVGPTQAQLDKSLKNITGSEPMRTDSNSKLVGYLAMIGFYDLPLDYLKTFNDKVSAVTVESIKDAWQRRLAPDNFVTVVVGN